MAIVETITLEGADEVKSAFEDIGKAGDEALKAIQAAGGDNSPAFAQLSSSLNDIKSQFAAAGSGTSQFGEAAATGSGAIASLGSAIASIGTFLGGLTVGAVAAGAGIVALGSNASDAAQKIQEAADTANVDVTAWHGLASAAQQVGVETGTLSEFFAKANEESVNFTRESEKAFDIFQKAGSGFAAGDQYNKTIAELTKNMGIFGGTADETKLRLQGFSDKDFLGGLDSKASVGEKALLQYADTIKAIGDPAEQTKRAMADLSVKLGADLLPFLQLGRAGIEDYVKAWHESGLELTKAQTDIAGAEQIALANLKTAIEGSRTQTGLLFAPLITAGADWLTETLISWRKSISEFASGAIPRAISLLDDFVAALSGGDVKIEWVSQLTTAIVGLGSAIGSVVGGAFQALLGVLDALAGKFNITFGTDFSGKSLLLASSIAAISSAFGVFGVAIGGAIALFSPFGANISRILPVIDDFIAALSGRGADVKNPWVLQWTQAFEDLGNVISGSAAVAFNALVSAADAAGAELGKVFGAAPLGAAVALAGLVAGLSSGFGLFSAAAAAAGAVFASFGLSFSNILPLINDFVAALSGSSDVLANPQVLAWADAIRTFGAEVKSVITGFVIPAFHALVDAAGTVAKTINDALGTNFSGLALLTGVAIFHLAGGFNLLKLAVVGIGGVLFDLAVGLGLAGRAGGALAEVFAIFGIAAKAVVPELRAAGTAVVEQRGAWGVLTDLFVGIGAALKNIGSIIGIVIVPAFVALSGAASAVASALNAALGTNYTANQVLIAGFILDLIGGFKLLALAMSPVVLAAGVVYGALRLLGASDTTAAFAAIAAALGAIAIGLATAIAPLFTMTAAWALLATFVAVAATAIVVFWPTIKAAVATGLNDLLALANDFSDKFARALLGDKLFDVVSRFSKDLSEDAAGWKKIFGELFGVSSAQAAESPLAGTPEKSQKDTDALNAQSKSIRDTFIDDREAAKKKLKEFAEEFGIIQPAAKAAADGTKADLATIPPAGVSAFEWIKARIQEFKDLGKAASDASAETAAKSSGTGSATVEVISGTVSQVRHIFKEGVDGISADLGEIPKAAGEAGKATVEVIEGTVSKTVRLFKESGAEAAKLAGVAPIPPEPPAIATPLPPPRPKESTAEKISDVSQAASEITPAAEAQGKALVEAVEKGLKGGIPGLSAAMLRIKSALVDPENFDATPADAIKRFMDAIAREIENGKAGPVAAANLVLEAIRSTSASTDIGKAAGERFGPALESGIRSGSEKAVEAIRAELSKAAPEAEKALQTVKDAIVKQIESGDPDVRTAGSGLLLAFNQAISAPDATVQSVFKDLAADLGREIDSGKPGVETAAHNVLNAIQEVFSGAASTPADVKAGNDIADAISAGIDAGVPNARLKAAQFSEAFTRALSSAPHAASAAGEEFAKFYSEAIAKGGPGAAEQAARIIDGTIKEFNKIGGEGTAALKPADFAAAAAPFIKPPEVAPPPPSANASAQALIAPFADAKTRIAAILAEIPGLITAALGSLSGSIAAVSTEIDATISAIISKLRAAIAEAKALGATGAPLSPAAAAAGTGAPAPQQFAGGGAVTGAGTGRSDSIPARLSHGEYVEPSESVMYYGLPFMDAIRSRSLPKPDSEKPAAKGRGSSDIYGATGKDAFGRDIATGGFSPGSGEFAVPSGEFSPAAGEFAAFALGGLVRALSMPPVAVQMLPVPQFAGGGPVSSNQRTFTLAFGGREFPGVSGPSHIVDAMERHATLSQMSSTTRRSASRIG